MRLLSDDVQGVAFHISGGVASLVGPVFGERRLHVVLAVNMQVGVTVFPDEIPVAQASNLGDERHPWGDVVAVGVKPVRLSEFRARPEVNLSGDLGGSSDRRVLDSDREGQSGGNPLPQGGSRRIPDPGVADGRGEHQPMFRRLGVGVVPVEVLVGRLGLALVVGEVPSVRSDAPDDGCGRVAVYRVGTGPSRTPRAHGYFDHVRFRGVVIGGQRSHHGRVPFHEMVAYDSTVTDCAQIVFGAAHDADGLTGQHAVAALLTFGVLPPSSGGSVLSAAIGRSAGRIIQGLIELAGQQYGIVEGGGIVVGDGLVAVVLRRGQRVPGFRVRRQ